MQTAIRTAIFPHRDSFPFYLFIYIHLFITLRILVYVVQFNVTPAAIGAMIHASNLQLKSHFFA